MSPDLTVLYYTANRIHAAFAEAVRAELVQAVGGRYPILCISHQPLAFGDAQITVGAVPCSAWQVYQNILVGARVATTEYIACAEDDSVYVPAHFDVRPDPDVFGYNRHRWVLTRRLSSDGTRREGIYYFRERTQMAQCIARRSLMIEALEERFRRVPDPLPDSTLFKMGWGEPGRYEKNLGLAPRTRVYFETAEPNVTINHVASLRGRRRLNATDVIQDVLPQWGHATDLWARLYGDGPA